MKKICILLTEPIETYYRKGEIKERYYNPCDFFDEVHMISLCDKDIDEESVRIVAGRARLVIHPVGWINLFNIPQLFAKRKRILAVIRAIAPDIIRSYDPFFCGWSAAYCGRVLKIPVVASVHNNFDDVRRVYLRHGRYLKFLKSLLASRFYEHYVFKNADRIICVYKFVAEYVKKYRVKNTEVIYNKIDTERFKPADAKEKPDRIRVICVGRLIEEKGQEVLIRAVKDMDVDLLLIGNGPMYEKLIGLIEQMGLSARVKIIKSVPNKDLPGYYASSDIFATAIQWGGVGIPVLEAMASGLPVITSKPENQPYAEVVEDAGIAVERNEADSFKRVIKRLLDNPGLRDDLSKKGREKILEINKDKMELKELDIYKQLMV